MTNKIMYRCLCRLCINICFVRNTFVAAFLLSISLACFGQGNSYQTVYHCQLQGPLINSKLEGEIELFFNSNESICIHKSYPRENKYAQSSNIHSFSIGDPDGFPYHIDLKSGFLTYKVTYSILNELFIIKENIPKIDWNITKQSKTIGQFTCKKAFGSIGGRIYDVWFTSDIPVPFGPHKLGGLPGLILEARSRDGYVIYDFCLLYTSDAADE